MTILSLMVVPDRYVTYIPLAEFRNFSPQEIQVYITLSMESAHSAASEQRCIIAEGPVYLQIPAGYANNNSGLFNSMVTLSWPAVRLV